MDARRLFAFSTWRVARIERPLLALDRVDGTTRLTFTLRDLARGCLLGRDSIDLNDAACGRLRTLRAALGGLELTAENAAILADAELDVALDSGTGRPIYRAVPELVSIRAGVFGG